MRSTGVAVEAEFVVITQFEPAILTLAELLRVLPHDTSSMTRLCQGVFQWTVFLVVANLVVIMGKENRCSNTECLKIGFLVRVTFYNIEGLWFKSLKSYNFLRNFVFWFSLRKSRNIWLNIREKKGRLAVVLGGS